MAGGPKNWQKRLSSDNVFIFSVIILEKPDEKNRKI